MKYQLWNQDEYGTGAIIGTFDSADKAISQARQLVTSANFGNSLSSVEQLRNIESYFVEMVGKKDDIDSNVIYGGNRRGGKFVTYKIGSTDSVEFTPDKSSVRIYVGSKFTKKGASKEEAKIYMSDDKGNLVSTLNHKSLAGKSIYFIVPLA
jgi:hypothetical protein